MWFFYSVFPSLTLSGYLVNTKCTWPKMPFDEKHIIRITKVPSQEPAGRSIWGEKLKKHALCFQTELLSTGMDQGPSHSEVQR